MDSLLQLKSWVDKTEMAGRVATLTEAPARYPNIPELLDRADPKNTDDIFYKQESWPGYNREQEADLQKKLEALADKTQPEGVKEIQDLEKRHSHRRTRVWRNLAKVSAW